MPFVRSNSPVDLGVALSALPPDPPSIDEKMLERFPELREYNKALKEYLIDLVTVLQRLEKDLKENSAAKNLTGRGAPVGTPPFGTNYTDNNTGDFWNFSKQGWVMH